MRLTPQEAEIGPEDGFTEANDLFGYAAFGERFANLFGTKCALATGASMDIPLLWRSKTNSLAAMGASHCPSPSRPSGLAARCEITGSVRARTSPASGERPKRTRIFPLTSNTS